MRMVGDQGRRRSRRTDLRLWETRGRANESPASCIPTHRTPS